MMKIILAFLFLINQVSNAKSTAESSHSDIRLIPFIINKSANVGGLLENLSPFMTAEEIQYTKKFVLDHGVNMNTPLPEVKRNGDELSISSYAVRFTSNGELEYKGTFFRKQKQETFDQLAKRIHATLIGKKTSDSKLINLLITRAYAADDRVNTGKEMAKESALVATIAVVSAVVMAGIVISSLPVTAPAASVVALSKLILAVGAVETVGAVGIGATVGYKRAQRMKRVTCDGDKLVLKTDVQEVQYNFDKNQRLTLPAIVTNSKGIVINKVEKFDADTTEGLEALFYQACKLNRAVEMTDSLNKVQEKIVEKKYSPEEKSGVK